MKRTLIVALLLTPTACSNTESTSNGNNIPGPPAASQPRQPATAAPPPAIALQEGEASGSILVEGQTINLKYAYARYDEIFDRGIVILLSEARIAPKTLEDAFKRSDSFTIFPKDSKGLEYNVGIDFWVMYHLGGFSGFQYAGPNTLTDYAVENGIIRGRDDYRTEYKGEECIRSVSFVATLPEKK